MISNQIINDPRLSNDAKVVMYYLLSKPDNWLVFNDDIQNHLHFGRDKVISIMGELKKYGYIRRTRTSVSHKFVWTTQVIEAPEIVDTEFRIYLEDLDVEEFRNLSIEGFTEQQRKLYEKRRMFWDSVRESRSDYLL